MPGKRYIFGDTIYQLIQKMIENETLGYSMSGRLNLGGSSGSDGGGGGWPRPPVGLLPQKYVANDTTEAETPELYGITRSGWWNSLLDNLNHIRYWQQPARMFEPQFDGTLTIDVREGLWWRSAGLYVDFDGGDITITTPHATLPRIDIIYIDQNGNVQVSEGTPAAEPAQTWPGGTHLPVAEIWIKPLNAPGITVSGIGYAYMSGYAQGYLYNDIRPYYGVNYDSDITGAQYLPDLMDVDDDVTTNATHRQVLAYDGPTGEWTNMEFFYGGVGGGQPALQIDGPIVTMQHVGGAYIATRSGELSAVYIYARQPGTAGQTTVDVNMNGTTVFSNPSHRPSLLWDDANQVQKSITLSGVSFGPETVFTVDIDEVATNSADLTVVLALDILTAHPHSDGPHTGVVWLSELEDGAISGYPLISQGNSLDGGPMYLPINTVGIYNNAVTYDKLGIGAAKIRARQGGSSTNWSTPGTTNYDTTTQDMKIQTGSEDIAVPGLTGTNPWRHKAQLSITFPTAFSYAPVVLASIGTGATQSSDNYNQGSVEVVSTSASGCTIYVGLDGDFDRTVTIHWIAIGIE